MSDDPRFESVQRRSVERLRAQIIRYDQMIAEYEDSTGRHPDDTPISPDELPNVFAARREASGKQIEPGGSNLKARSSRKGAASELLVEDDYLDFWRLRK